METTTITIQAFCYEHDFTDLFGEADRQVIEDSQFIHLLCGDEERCAFIGDELSADYNGYWSDAGELVIFSDEEFPSELRAIAEAIGVVIDTDERVGDEEEEAA